MPRDERYPTPLLNMSPSGLAGFFVVIGMSLGLVRLVGGFNFLVGLASVTIIAVPAALLIRRWRARHPSDESLLHLEAGRRNGDGKNV